MERIEGKRLDFYAGRDVTDFYRADEVDALIVAVEEQLKVTYQTLLEVRHAQEVGASWYTRGANGLYGQVAMWVRRGFEAIDKARAALNGNAAPR